MLSKSLGELNLYSYCANNPIMYTDGSGTFAISLTTIGMIIGLIVGATVGGIIAYNIASKNGAKGWELFGWTMLGILGGGIIGGALGYGAGALVSKLTGIVGFSVTKHSIVPIKSTTLLGHMPGYIATANAAGTGYYLIPQKTYESLTMAQRLANNMQYLADANSLKSLFALAPDYVVLNGGTLWREIQFLIQNGIPWMLF